VKEENISNDGGELGRPSRSSRKQTKKPKKKSIGRKLTKGLFVMGTSATLLATAGGGIGGVYDWDNY